MASAANLDLHYLCLWVFQSKNLGKLKSVNPDEIKECKEILTSVRNPRLKKFADSHAPYGKQAEYRQAVNKASLKKLLKC